MKHTPEETERRTITPAPLRDEQLRAVAGGRKAGKCQQEYLRVTMTEAMIGPYTPTPSGS